MDKRQANDHYHHDYGKGISIAVAAFFVLLKFFLVA
jgi:hypothetical protein